MVKALYAGSFDPLTNGHLDILIQAADCFDEIIIGVAENSNKKAFIPVQDRVNLIKSSITMLQNIKVVSYQGLTTDFAKENNVSVLIRGLRNSQDFEYEYQISQNNSLLNHNIKTVFFVPHAENSFISSSIVREIAINKGDISKLVPEPVYKFLN